MKKRYFFFALSLALGLQTQAREYHVSVNGNDFNNGTEKAPLKTINKAAQLAFAGDVITVHTGTYREWIDPPRGGTDDDNRIVYRAAAGEKVEIKGSEIITGWEKTSDGIWKVTLPNSFFGSHNPYKELVYGDWLDDFGRIHHTGEVFLNGKSLYEKETLEKVIYPTEDTSFDDTDGSKYVWYCESDEETTTIWANFQKFNPNKEQAEISTRFTCFYPSKQGIDFLTIDGFDISQAATQWGAPTAEQIGMVATHWNKGWVIENNTIHDSKCSGITLGKERATGHNVWLADQSIDGSLHYIEVTFKTLRNGWSKDNIGSHIVRGNHIYNCEQTGICGSMGAAFSLIENNHIHDIWTKRQFSGAEIGGIKFHAAIDTQIKNNRIHRVGRGVWLDWMSQGTRVSCNLFYDNDLEDIFVEVNHGPFIIDNNILGSPRNLLDWSQGGAYAHNLFMGAITRRPEKGRYTPYHLSHSTEVSGLSIIPGGDNRFFNNLFAPTAINLEKKYGFFGLSGYNDAEYPMFVGGNGYSNGALPFGEEKNRAILAESDCKVKIEEDAGKVFLSFDADFLNKVTVERVDTDRLGKAKIPKLAYENPDGSALVINADYLGQPRGSNPMPGPFEIKGGKARLPVW